MSNTLNRKELFDLIWSKPTAKLAEELGISDVAISKWCKKMQIPKPPRGYWAKKQVGKNVPQKPKLKKLTKTDVNKIEYSPSPVRPKDETEQHVEVIPGSLETPHKLVKASLKALSKGKPWGDRNIIHSKNKKVLDIQVTQDSVARACLIFDSVIKTLAAEGIPVSLEIGEHTSKTIVEIDGYQTEIGIDERTKRVEVKKGEMDRYWYPKYEFLPTGMLTFVVRKWTHGVRSEWKDGKIQRIENLIPSIVNSLKLIAVKHSEWELEKAEQEKRLKQAKATQRKEAIKELKCEKILAHMEMWKKACDLKEFLKVLKETSKETPEIEEYIELGLSYAERINPLNWTDLASFDEDELKRELPYSLW